MFDVQKFILKFSSLYWQKTCMHSWECAFACKSQLTVEKSSETQDVFDRINGEQFIVEFSDTLEYHHPDMKPRAQQNLMTKGKNSLSDRQIWYSR